MTATPASSRLNASSHWASGAWPLSKTLLLPPPLLLLPRLPRPRRRKLRLLRRTRRLRRPRPLLLQRRLLMLTSLYTSLEAMETAKATSTATTSTMPLRATDAGKGMDKVRGSRAVVVLWALPLLLLLATTLKAMGRTRSTRLWWLTPSAWAPAPAPMPLLPLPLPPRLLLLVLRGMVSQLRLPTTGAMTAATTAASCPCLSLYPSLCHCPCPTPLHSPPPTATLLETPPLTLTQQGTRSTLTLAPATLPLLRLHHCQPLGARARLRTPKRRWLTIPPPPLPPRLLLLLLRPWAASSATALERALRTSGSLWPSLGHLSCRRQRRSRSSLPLTGSLRQPGSALLSPTVVLPLLRVQQGWCQGWECLRWAAARARAPRWACTP